MMKYKTQIALYNSYFDLNDNLSVKSILNIFQDVASIHADEIGVGYKEMLKKNLYWVLSRIKIDILKMPKINQTVIVETWPLVKGRIDFDRDLKITSLEGETLIVGTSKWCVIDVVKRALQRTDNVNYVGEYCNDINYLEKFNKINLPDGEWMDGLIHRVTFSDLDHNKHMNNTNYANLVMSVVDNKVISHFEINFISECKQNENIAVYVYKTNDGEFVKGLVGDRVAFSAFTR